MGNKNYRNYSKPANEPGVTEEVNMNIVMNNTIENPEAEGVNVDLVMNPPVNPTDNVNENPEIEDTNKNPDLKIGVIVDCSRLYVRKGQSKNSEPLCIIKQGEEVEINLAMSTKDFYRVTTPSGVVGYCVKDFVCIK